MNTSPNMASTSVCGALYYSITSIEIYALKRGGNLTESIVYHVESFTQDSLAWWVVDFSLNWLGSLVPAKTLQSALQGLVINCTSERFIPLKDEAHKLWKLVDTN
jgi:hypothetical protein